MAALPQNCLTTKLSVAAELPFGHITSVTSRLAKIELRAKLNRMLPTRPRSQTDQQFSRCTLEQTD
jgi:hypothetical protein